MKNQIKSIELVADRKHERMINKGLDDTTASNLVASWLKNVLARHGKYWSEYNKGIVKSLIEGYEIKI